MSGAGRRSPRVDATCPSFTNIPPHSSSVARRHGPNAGSAMPADRREAPVEQPLALARSAAPAGTAAAVRACACTRFTGRGRCGSRPRRSSRVRRAGLATNSHAIARPIVAMIENAATRMASSKVDGSRPWYDTGGEEHTEDDPEEPGDHAAQRAAADAQEPRRQPGEEQHRDDDRDELEDVVDDDLDHGSTRSPAARSRCTLPVTTPMLRLGSVARRSGADQEQPDAQPRRRASDEPRREVADPVPGNRRERGR